jgi:hypothetical protein
MILYLIAFLGVGFHLIMKFRDAYTKQEVFNWKRQLILSGFSLVIAAILITFRKDLITFLVKSGIDLSAYADAKLLWFLVSYFADSVWKNVETTGRTTLKIEDTPNPN